MVMELQCPPSVAAYAKFMNGVDMLNQNMRQNKSKKIMKWYRRVETKLMETSIYNTYVIEGDTVSHKVDGKTKQAFCPSNSTLLISLSGITTRKDLRQEGDPVVLSPTPHPVWITLTTGQWLESAMTTPVSSVLHVTSATRTHTLE